ncbi:hypothetical protein [Cronobacter muytjensii]|uniref:hypothetical protein n=1 Tax=Cronobacter muytjensii TaxID=413501 RepID=UPI001F2FFD04|nr:hypothetical protein [Cronobacter muytjensii]MEB8641318.1 hypothetical protein [Cronobacter muytjensii]
MQQNTVRQHFSLTKAVAFPPSFAIGRGFTAAEQKPHPDKRLYQVEQSGIQRFQANIRYFLYRRANSKHLARLKLLFWRQPTRFACRKYTDKREEEEAGGGNRLPCQAVTQKKSGNGFFYSIQMAGNTFRKAPETVSGDKGAGHIMPPAPAGF